MKREDFLLTFKEMLALSVYMPKGLCGHSATDYYKAAANAQLDKIMANMDSFTAFMEQEPDGEDKAEI